MADVVLQTIGAKAVYVSLSALDEHDAWRGAGGRLPDRPGREVPPSLQRKIGHRGADHRVGFINPIRTERADGKAALRARFRTHMDALFVHGVAASSTAGRVVDDVDQFAVCGGSLLAAKSDPTEPPRKRHAFNEAGF